MEPLKQLILGSEDEIVRRVIASSRVHGYTQHLPSLEESYRDTVAVLSANLAQSINSHGGAPALSADEDLDTDPVVALGARMVRTHLIDAVDSRVFLGMLKHYRAAYRDLVADSGQPVDAMWRDAQMVDRFFDRVELGAMGELSVNPADVVKADMLERLAELGGQRDRYVAAFADLPVAVLLLDDAGLVEDMNDAAALLFRPLDRTRPRHQSDASRREAPPVLADEIQAFLAAPERESSFERELSTGKGTRYFQVRITKTFAADDRLTGALVILNDLTYRRHAEEALRRGQAKYQTLFENMTAGFAYTKVMLDSRNRPKDFTILEANAAFGRLTGIGTEGVAGRSVFDALRRDGVSDVDWPAVLGRVAVTGEASVFEAALGAGSDWFSVSVYTPSPGNVSVMLADVTELKRTQESLARSRDFYLELFEGSPSPTWRAEPDGRVDYVNTAWLEFTGHSAKDGIGDAWLKEVHPSDRERRHSALANALQDRKPFAIEYRLRHRSGEYRWMLEAGRPFTELDGTFGGVIGSMIDISDRKRQEEALQHLSTHDPLTGLPIRRLLDEAVTRAIAHARRGHLSSIVFLDVDDLKSINDACGHLIGDSLLRDVADVLVSSVRAEDLLCRAGGDEFAVLMHDTPLDGACAAAQRIHTAIACAGLGPAGAGVTVSIAVIELDGRSDAQAAAMRADSALRRAKAAGGNRVEMCSNEAAPTEADEPVALSILDRVQRAIGGDGGFLLYFQPVFSIADGSLDYSEALIRLADGAEVIEAGRFIEIAERAGLMPEVTCWVIQRAARVLEANPAARLSLNLSRADLADRGLIEVAASVMEGAGVDPGRLVFEITEACVMPDLKASARWVAAAREAGFRFALDKFGAGYESTTCLKEIPVDHVKLDGIIVRSLLGDPRQLALVDAMQTVASGRGITTVATCVENEYVLNALRSCGVDRAQGYHLGMPLPYLVDGPNAPWETLFPGGRAPGTV